MGELKTTVQAFREYLKKMRNYEEAVGVIGWDMRTGAPKKGAAQRSEVVGTLAAELFKMSVSDEMEQYINQLSDPGETEQLDDLTRACVRECSKEFSRSKKIPPDLYHKYVVLTANAENAWEEARRSGNFAEFLPYLEQIVDYNQQFVELWGYEGHKYDALLDYYEPGMTVSKLDSLFQDLRSRLLPLLQAVLNQEQPRADFLGRFFAVGKQREFCEYLLHKIGYDFEAGRLDVSAHPFATGLNPGDVRITTRFDEHDFKMALFGCIHEFGHALYEQNLDPELIGTPLCSGTSMGIHESQSRFWENMAGRSYEFWENFYPDLVSRFPEQLQDVNLGDFYKGINLVHPSFIRVEADELTYNFHIMLRYELEKGLIGGEIRVRDLPEIWNGKMKEYLGIVPPNDKLGVLQDVHWAGGSFGYFPSYSLGNVYAAQFAAAAQREMPDFKEKVRSGDFSPLRNWLKEKIHRYGKRKSPAELLLDVTGEEINASYLVRYLEQKYRRIYGMEGRSN